MLQLNSKSIPDAAQGFDEVATKVFNGCDCRVVGDMVCITDLFKASGSSKEKDPFEFIRHGHASRALNSLDPEFANTGKSRFIQRFRGRTGGTWAHTDVALRYCEWVSQEMYDWATLSLKRQIQEERNPELKMSRGAISAREKYEQMGKDQEWIDNRLRGVTEYHNLNSSLRFHGCEGPKDYQIVHGAVTRSVTGSTAKQLQEARGVKTTRDGMSAIELNLVAVTQMATKNNMDKLNLNGCYQIAAEASKIGTTLRQALSTVLA